MDLLFDPTATGFSPANARACAAASRLAYSEPPDITATATGTHAIVRDCGNAIVVAFRGTADLRDFITDAEAWRQNIQDCQIHYGFYQALISVNDELTAHIARLPPRPIFITGHSLGGALAMLFAFRLVLPPFTIGGVYTFGQPRVGNRNFARLYDRFQPANTFRFVNELDIVPRIPGVLSGYHHAGQEIFLPAPGGMQLNPPLWFKLLSDAWGAWREWQHGTIAQLADHHMDKYLFKVNALSEEPRVHDPQPASQTR